MCYLLKRMQNVVRLRIARRCAFFVIPVLFATLLACRTGPVTIPEDLTQAELFQRGQEALDAGRFAVALQYYETFLERFPNDRVNGAEARYEIAFIHYRMDEWDTARRLFAELIAKYDAPDAEELPAWPRVLSLRVLEVMDEGGWPPPRPRRAARTRDG